MEFSLIPDDKTNPVGSTLRFKGKLRKTAFKFIFKEAFLQTHIYTQNGRFGLKEKNANAK